ncbi:MAG: carboxypeptidase regulatory-like domain-containing protein, partial [Ferruginibacter sp.]
MHMNKWIFLFLLMAGIPFCGIGQVTTSNLSGTVKNRSGNGLAGATITAIHEPTGTVYTSVARGSGRYDINNMNPGGPYSVSVTFSGFEVNNEKDVYLVLGETKRSDFTMVDKTDALKEVIVVGSRVSTPKNGAETTIDRQKLGLLPTIGRNINDFVRFTPQTKITANGGISIAGQNNRFNGFLIDGAVNNDVFGLSETGTN